MFQIVGSVLAVLFLSTPLLAESLRGKVLDPQGAAIPQAQVKLHARASGIRWNTSTDAGGQFQFERLGPGEYVLDAEAVGFGRGTVPPFRLERGIAKTLDLTLQILSVREEIVVTAAGSPQPVDEVSKSVSVVSWQEIQERDEFSLAEVLRTTPGLRYQQLGGPGSFTSFKSRGLRNEDTAVLVDGQRLRDVAGTQGDASGLLGDLIVTNVDRLEVLRGSGSSLYGTNAIGGVVNVITDEGGGRTRGSVLAEGGSLGLFRGRAQVAGGWLKDRIAYSAGVAHLNVSDGVDGDDAARNTSGQGKIRFQLTPTSTLSARIYATDAFVQVNTGPSTVGTLPASGIIEANPLNASELKRYENGTSVSQLNLGNSNFIPSANDPDYRRAANFLSSQFTFAQRPSDLFGYSVTYQNLRTDRSFFDGPGGVSFQPGGNTRLDNNGRVLTLNAKTDFRLGRFNYFDAGYEFESENYINRSFDVFASDNSTVDVTQRSHAFFVQDQVRLLSDRLQLSAAFRSQYFSLRQPELLPASSAPYAGMAFTAPPTAYTGDGSVAYFFRKSGTKLRAHAGNGYRAPSLYERFGTFFGSFGYSAYGDPRLRPDRSIAFDAGVDQSLNSRVRVSATYFYTRLQEVIIFDFSGAIDPVTDPFGRFGGYRNSHGGLARGLEISASAAASRSLDVSASYTYNNADQRVPIVAGVLRSFAIPDHQFTVVATQRIGQRLFVNFDLVTSSSYLAPIFDSNTFATRAFQFGGLAKADLGASYRLPVAENRSLRFFGKVENLLNREYFEGGYRTPGTTAVGGMQFEF